MKRNDVVNDLVFRRFAIEGCIPDDAFNNDNN